MRGTGASPSQSVTPIRVVHAISSPAAGGAEILVKDLVLDLARRGHRPAIAFLSRAADIGRSDEFERSYLVDLEAAGIPYTFIGHKCRRNPLLGALRTRRFLRDQRADIYHSHLKYALLFGALLGLPHVHTHHNERRHAPRWMWPVFNRIVTAYVGISELCADRLASFTRRPVTIIRNAVDPARIGTAPARPRNVHAGHAIRCIAVGAPSEQKNLGLLVAAFALLPPETLASLTLDIVGQGSPDATAELAAQIDDAGQQAHIRLSGISSDVPALLGKADLFLMSSAWEGMSIALLEATTAGLPFISTDVGGSAELARLCSNGIIVPRGDAAAFARALASIAADPCRIEAMSRSALERAGALAIVHSAEAHLALYQRLLDRQAPRRRREARRKIE